MDQITFFSLKRLGYLLLIIGMQLATYSASAQQEAVSGVIRYSSGEPIPGVAVYVKGTTNGTTTDFDGNFTLNNVPEGAILVASYLGMETEEIPIAGQRSLEIVMSESSIALDEIVAIGYGTMTKKDLTTSVASVNSEQLDERTTAFNILEGMAGKVAGVSNVSFSGRPGGASSLRIRGMGSVNANNNPIYVLDGVVGIDPQIINPENVGSIEVLKDAAATAMYGAQGANGVVIITTKDGGSRKGTVTYTNRVGFGMMGRKIDVLNAEEYMEVQRRAYAYSGKVMPHLLNPMENLFDYEKDALGNFLRDGNGNLIASPKYDTDWQDEISRTSVIRDHNLSFASGNENTSIFASLGYQDFEGLIKYTYSKRFTGTLNIKTDINDWLNLQGVVTHGNSKRNDGDQEGGFGQGPVRNMIEMPPIVPVRYEDGTWGRKGDYPLSEAGENPLLLLRDRKNLWHENYTVFNMIATADITDKLQLTVKGDAQTTNRRNMSFAKGGLLDITDNTNGYADIFNEVQNRYSSENYFTYNDRFLDDDLQSTFVLGASWYYFRLENASAGSEQYFDDFFDYHNLGAGTVFHQPSSFMNQNTQNSYYFRMNHNYKDKYLLGFTFRADGASNFGDNHKYGYFPSVSAAWRISEEGFFEPVRDVMNNLKLRLSYGAVGNSSIPNYITFSSYSNESLIFNKELQPYVVLSNLGNQDLKWESSNQLNFGLDIGLFRNRVELLADYYIKSTKDLLFNRQVPFTTGYTNTWTNLGEIRNEGLELTLTTRNIATEDFNWTTDVIFSTNRLEVVDIGGETIDTGNNTIAREGEEWASYFVLNRLGTWGLDEIDEAVKYGKKPGDIKYEDVNGDYIIDDSDRQIMGNGLPKGDLSMVNTFSYKGLSLLVDLNYRYGAKIMGITSTMLENRPIFANSLTSVLDAWGPESQNSMIPAIRLPSDVNFGENEKDSRMLYNGDFLRIRNVGLSYAFSQEVIERIGFLSALSLGLNVENLHVFSPFPGFDPEIGAFGKDTGQSIEFYAYPRPTTVSTNIKVTF